MEAGKGTPTSEGMLANFFNSLLNKSTAKTPGATKAGKGSVELRKYRVMSLLPCCPMTCYCTCTLAPNTSLISPDYH